MPVLARPRDWGLKKPSVNASINFGHPLAHGLTGCWLMNQNAGPVRSLINPSDQLVLRTNSQWQFAYELGVSDKGTAATNSGMNLATPSALLKPPTMATLVWRGMFLGDVAGGVQNPRVASLDANATDVAPFVSYGIYRPTTDAIVFAWNNGTFRSSGSIASTLSTRYLKPIQLAIVHNGNAGTVKGYDGAKQVYTTASLVGTITYAAAAELVVGGSASKAAAVNAVTSLVYAYNRPLQPQEIAWLNAEPYAFIDPRRPLRYAAIADAVTFRPQIRVY